MTASRPGKLSHSQTVLYEIDLFRHAANRLLENRWQSEMDKWVYIEAFLLHFRNLIELFGRMPERDTLSIQRPDRFWPDPGKRPSDTDLGHMYRPDLWEKYEGRGNPEKISRYLQHCTEQRVEPKEWKIGEMIHELSSLIDNFEQRLPSKTRTWAVPVTRVFLGSESAGTNTVIKHS